MVRFIKSKFYNYLTTHLDLVVRMYAQQFYKLETFPSSQQSKIGARTNCVMDTSR